MINRTFKRLIDAIGILISFEEILRVGQITDKEIRKDFPIKETCHISGKFCEVLPKNMHPLRLVCIKIMLSE